MGPNNSVGQVDVERRHAIIEVTNGVGNGKYGQAVKFRANREINPSKKAVIVYLPNKDVPPGLIAEFARGKFVVVRSLDDLVTELRSLGDTI